MLSEMIEVYDYGYEPTNQEIRILLKCFKPGQKLPQLNNLECPGDYPGQLVYENHLDRLLEGYTLKFVMNRTINERKSGTYLIASTRLTEIYLGIDRVIER